MYPLPVVLVGIDDDLLGDIRMGLAGALAEVEFTFASASAVSEHLRHCKNDARLLIVHVSPEAPIAPVRKLAASFVGWPIVALVPGDRVCETYLEVNRAGAAQVVPLPLDRDDFHSALIMIASQFGRRSLDRHVFAVTGATGGSGATTVALNLAAEIADQVGRSTILAELTLQMGALASLLDVMPRVTLAHLIQEIHRVDDLLIEKTLLPVSENLKILAGPDKLHSLPLQQPGDLLKIVECMKKLADVTVLDMPGSFHAAEFEVINAADQVVLVGLQSVPSIRSLKLFCESLPQERLLHSLWVVINRYNPTLKGFTRDDMQQMLGVPNVRTIANDYQAVSLAANQGTPLRLAAARSPILDDIEGLMRDLLGLEPPEVKTRRKGLVGRVLSTLSR